MKQKVYTKEEIASLPDDRRYLFVTLEDYYSLERELRNLKKDIRKNERPTTEQSSTVLCKEKD